MLAGAKRRGLVAVLLALTGCATAPPAPRISLEEALAEGDHQRESSGPVDPRASPQLRAAIAGFLTEAGTLRSSVPRGAPMPPSHAAAWFRVLAACDEFLLQPPAALSVLDAVRARLNLEDALHLDGQHYGDVERWVPERAQDVMRRLGRKVASLTTPKRLRASSAFAWPLSPVQITSPYGTRQHPVLGDVRQHHGVDLYAYADQPVFATAAGTVSYAGWNGAHGKHVELVHDEHYSSAYSHLQTVLVESGAEVERGQLLGLAGKTGRATGVHLHFELRLDGESTDPVPLLPAIGAEPTLISDRGSQ